MQYSIIVPLEFHRGLTDRCVAGWTQQQSFPRDQFEVIVAAPASRSESERNEISQLLNDHDRLLVIEADHDMPLVAEAAKVARGQVLVFTEAHCLPRPDFLDQATKVLEENPSWAGFSGQSIPITHNLLSEIEAETYLRDIQRNLETHPWLKVLDQCFVVRNSAYRLSGGFEPQYGHFAEWLLAARLHRSDQTIGYDPRAVVEHYYCGDIEELEEFTRDFCHGQVQFCHQSVSDPCGDLFEEVPLWSDRLRFDRSAARCMARMLRRDGIGLLKRRIFGRRELAPASQVRDWPYRTALKWLLHSTVPLDWRIRFSERQARRLRKRTQEKLEQGDRPGATQAYGELMQACSTIECLKYIRENPEPHSFELGSSEPTHGSRWSSGIRQSIPSVGFYGIEILGGGNFRWSEPAAMVKLPPLAGDWTIVITWARIRTLEQQLRARFYLNERPVPPDQIQHFGDHTEIRAKQIDGKELRLAWVIENLVSEGDERGLGFPVKQISWIDDCDSTPSNESVVSPTQTTRPMVTYFLHVPKCAGTSTRLVLSNGTTVNQILGGREQPWFYYAKQLHDGKYIFDDYQFAAGHFGWELLAKVTDRPWQVVTMIREPFRRFQSMFVYLQQIKRLPEQLTFETWLEQQLEATNLTISYFLPNILDQKARGAAELAALIRPRLDEAIGNLRRCVVGLQESFEASLNLFADASPCLLPPLAPRVNVTINRTRPTVHSDAASPAMKEILDMESSFYQEAVALFHSQYAELRGRAEEASQRKLNTDQDLRDYLREKYLANVAVDSPFNQPSGKQIATCRWNAEDSYLGTNLFDRERHGGQWLRWSGPEPVTEFLLPVPSGTDYRLTMQLHLATPPSHGIGASLEIEGQPVPLVVQWSPQSFQMEAIVEASQFPNHKGPFARIALRHPVIREANAFRQIGLALLSMDVTPVTEDVMQRLHEPKSNRSPLPQHF